jgi:hypothetical protein
MWVDMGSGSGYLRLTLHLRVIIPYTRTPHGSWTVYLVDYIPLMCLQVIFALHIITANIILAALYNEPIIYY